MGYLKLSKLKLFVSILLVFLFACTTDLPDSEMYKQSNVKINSQLNSTEFSTSSMPSLLSNSISISLPIPSVALPSNVIPDTPVDNLFIDSDKAIEEVFKSFVKYNLAESIFKGIEYEDSEVARVIDGDTIELIDGRIIRYLGVDTPEKNECFYHDATLKNKLLVMLGNYNRPNKVRLYKGKVDTDYYGRHLRYVTSIDSEGEVLVNDYLIKYGYGLNVSEKYIDQQLPNIKSIFDNSAEEAKNNLLGIWKCK